MGKLLGMVADPIGRRGDDLCYLIPNPNTAATL